MCFMSNYYESLNPLLKYVDSLNNKYCQNKPYRFYVYVHEDWDKGKVSGHTFDVILETKDKFRDKNGEVITSESLMGFKPDTPKNVLSRMKNMERSDDLSFRCLQADRSWQAFEDNQDEYYSHRDEFPSFRDFGFRRQNNY